MAPVPYVINPQTALLSNHEVLLHLNSEEAEYSGTDGTGRARKKPAGYKIIMRDTLAYLNSSTPTPELSLHRPTRPKTVYLGQSSLFAKLHDYLSPNEAIVPSNPDDPPTKKPARKPRLEKGEFLQIVNLKPQSFELMELILDECEARFTEEELKGMMAIIKESFELEEKDVERGSENVIVPAKRKKKRKDL